MKATVSRERKSRRPFDKTHDVNTTSDWGFMQPTLCDEIVGKSSFTFKANTFCRLSPLVAPTFGRATVKHYAYYVPLRDIYMPYENLLGGEAYNGGLSTFIPTSVPVVSLRILTMMVIDSSYCRVFKGTILGDHFTYTSTVGYNVVRPKFLAVYNMMPSLLIDSTDVTLDNADFIIQANDGSDVYMLAIKFNRNSKHLRKVLLGLGYCLNYDSDVRDISILPLFAYYKAWFDLFAIKRTTNWQSTRCYRLSVNLAAYNVIDVFSDGTAWPEFNRFFRELAQCYYTDNPDYFTVHQASMNNTMTNAQIDTVYTTIGNMPGVGSVMSTPDQTAISGVAILSPIVQRLAQKMLKWTNKNTVIGQKLAAYFAAHGLGDVDDNKDMHFIGASSVNVDFTDTMSTSDTYNSTTKDGAILGDYAGKGSAVGNSDTFKYSPDSSGYFIVMCCVVPRCGYVQGLAPFLRHNTRFQFYNSDFEALFIQSTSRKDLLGACDVCFHDTPRQAAFDESFGLIPSYSEYKQRQNLANGDITLRSTRNNMLPYILDRWFTVGDLEPTNIPNEYRINKLAPFVVNDALRTIGSSELLGNFDRIFALYDTRVLPLEDPFILHNVYNYTVVQPMLPMKDSFDTDSADGDTMTVDHV